MKIKFIALLLPALFILSCSQKTKYCKITKTQIDGYPQATFFYDGDKLNRIETYVYGSGQLQTTSVFYYDLQGRVDYMNRYNADGTLLSRNEVSYDGFGNVGAIYFITDSDSDGYPDASSGYYIYGYNASNQLTTMSYYDATNTFMGTNTLTWVGDVITTMEFPAGNYDVITYDGNTSRFGNVLAEMFVYTTSFSNLVNQNITQIQHYDSGNNLTSTENFGITYNADGLPETIDQTFVILGFDYQCEER